MLRSLRAPVTDTILIRRSTLRRSANKFPGRRLFESSTGLNLKLSSNDRRR